MTAPEISNLSPHELARKAAEFALEKKGSDVVVMDLRDLSPVCDFFTIITGTSEPQVKALVDHIDERMRSLGEKPWHIEGREGKHWVLLDYVHVVVHVFLDKTREVYLLERLWGDAPREEMSGGNGDS